MTDAPESARILNSAEVEEVTSLSRSTIWRLERQGRFPRRFQLSDNRVGWLQPEVNDWIVRRRLQGRRQP